MKGAYTVALTALLSWVGGEAGRSWHLSVPFLAVWVILLGMVLLSSHMTGVIARAWHREKINATPQLVAIEKAAELAAEAAGRKYLASQGINL